MVQLAVKGHPTRGSEVIALLKMLGGKWELTCCNYTGSSVSQCYYIDGINGVIKCSLPPLLKDYVILTLEEFEAKYPYKVGDKVVTSLHWEGCIGTIIKMKWIDDEIIYEVQWNDVCKSIISYKTKALQSYKEQEPMEEKPFECIDFAKHPPISDKLEIILGDYEIVQENGKCYVIKKKPKYPKTYEECCKVLNISKSSTLYVESESKGTVTNCTYSCSLVHKLSNFRKLLICRDAYYAIIDEQMELGKPWEPDWNNVDQDKYVIYTDGNTICTNCFYLGHNILVFPTAEIRDTFYENFKDLIETCKELL